MPSLASSSVRLSAFVAFKAAVDAGSLNQAANMLFLSQSALSQQIRTLESTLGVELLRRTSRGIETTEEGRVFYEYCCRILDDSVALERRIRCLDHEAPEIWLGVETVLGEHLVPCALSEFRQESREVRLRLAIDHTHEIVESVRQGALHLGIVPDREDDPHLSWVHLLDQPLVVICHPDHPLSRRGEIELEELYEHQYIAREPWTKCRQLSTRALAGVGIEHDDLDISAEMKTFAGKKSAVMANMGYTIAPWCGVWREIADGSLLQVTLRGHELSYPVFLVERTAGQPTRMHSALREFLMTRDWSTLPAVYGAVE